MKIDKNKKLPAFLIPFALPILLGFFLIWWVSYSFGDRPEVTPVGAVS